MTVAELIARRLASAGVERAYGFPGGGSNLDLIEAFRAAGIEFVLTHTEVAAALMACAGAELERGVPGVVVVGNGPGLASVVNGAAHAHLDRVPLLVISDRYTDAELDTTGHQILDQRALLAPVVKWSATLDAASVGSTLDEALATALAAPCGAVHLDMPRTVGADTAREGPRAPRDLAAPPHAAATPHDLAAVVAALSAARHPVVLAGLEASRGARHRRARRPRRAARRARADDVQGQGRARRAASAVGGDRDRRGARGAAARGRGRDPGGRARPGRAADQAVAVCRAARSARRGRRPRRRRRDAHRAAAAAPRRGRRLTPRARADRAAHRVRQPADRLADRRSAGRGAPRGHGRGRRRGRAHVRRDVVLARAAPAALPDLQRAGDDGLRGAGGRRGGRGRARGRHHRRRRDGLRRLRARDRRAPGRARAGRGGRRREPEPDPHQARGEGSRPLVAGLPAGRLRGGRRRARRRELGGDDEASLRCSVREALATGGPALIDARLSGAEYARTLAVVRG